MSKTEKTWWASGQLHTWRDVLADHILGSHYSNYSGALEQTTSQEIANATRFIEEQ